MKREDGSSKRLSTASHSFLVVVGLLMMLGLVMVYSSGAVHNPSSLLIKQVVWVLLGLVFFLVMSRIDYRLLRRVSGPMVLLTLILLVLVLIPPFSREINGVRRWFKIGPFSFQPSELAKLSTIFFLSNYLTKKRDQIHDSRGVNRLTWIFTPLLLVGTEMLLIVVEPDLGASAYIGLLTFCLLFIGGVKVGHLISLILLLIPFLFVSIAGVAYRRQRILAFLDPWRDPTASGFQTIQSFIALGRGGLWGTGLGRGKQKLFFLPEPHTDFIYAVIGEELGLVGAGVVLLLFMILIWKGVTIALQMSDLFGRYMALGITLMIGLQGLIHMGVVTGLLPPKGLPLPFVSYGGSSLLVNMIGVGILLSMSRQRSPQ